MEKDPSGCVVLVPARDHIDPACEYNLRQLEFLGYTVWRVFGVSAIDQGRNRLATKALAKGFDELMWIDSDVKFDPESVEALRAHNLPIVCGIYAKKHPRFQPACGFLPGTDKIHFGKHGGLMELRHAAGGFLYTKREVYEKIVVHEKLPICQRNTSPRIPFFLPMVVEREDDHWYLGEDFAFCERARRSGYSIFADTRIRLEHVGRYSYSWDDANQPWERYAGYTIHLKENEEKDPQ